MVDRYAKYATEHLSAAAKRIESCAKGSGGNGGGNCGEVIVLAPGVNEADQPGRPAMMRDDAGSARGYGGS